MDKVLGLGCFVFAMMAGCLSSSDGTCGDSKTFATTPRPAYFATDNAFLYFTDAAVGGGSVRKVSVGGGDVTTLVPDVIDPYAIAVAGDTVYFTDAQHGLVMSVPKAGGATTTIASGEDFPYAIAVDDTNVYWTNRVTMGTVRAAQRAGGAGPPLTTLATGIREPRGIALAGGTVYFGSDDGMMQMPADGSQAPTPLTSRIKGADAVVVDGASVYWVDHPTTADGIYKAPLGGGNATLLASNGHQLSDVFSDGTSVYFTDITADIALKVSVSGGETSNVACGMKDPLGVTVVGNTVYVADLSGGAIISAPK